MTHHKHDPQGDPLDSVEERTREWVEFRQNHHVSPFNRFSLMRSRRVSTQEAQVESAQDGQDPRNEC